MSERLKDPGIGQKFDRIADRAINKDGSFNVKRINFGFSFKNIYQALIRMNWVPFFLLLTGFVLGANLLFAALYFIGGKSQLMGDTGEGQLEHFLQCLYFSFQSFTTVGYGSLSPAGHISGVISSIESVFGLISFAIITGLLYGRFSRPNTLFQYSKNVLISPYDEDLWSLQFRFANGRSNQVIELEANVLISYTEKTGDHYEKKYFDLTLETNKVLFFPLNWTLVHVIDEDSPIKEISAKSMEEGKAEIMILIKGFDDTFSQIVHSRYSYTWDEIVWGGKFIKPYFVNDEGVTVLDAELLDRYDKVPFEKV